MKIDGFALYGEKNAPKPRIGMMAFHDGFDERGVITEIRREGVMVVIADGMDAGREDYYPNHQLHLPIKGSGLDVAASIARDPFYDARERMRDISKSIRTAGGAGLKGSNHVEDLNEVTEAMTGLMKKLDDLSDAYCTFRERKAEGAA